VVVARRRAPAIALGIAWTALALLPVSNLLFVTGVLLAERSLFLPSVGAAVAVGGAVAMVDGWLVARSGLRVAAGAAVVACIAAGVFRSAIREPVWRDDHTLFARGVIDAPRDYYTHYLWADQLFNEGRTDDAAREAGRSIDLSRGYPPALALLADVYARDGACDRAIPLWRRALRVMPWLVPPRIGLATCLVRTGEYADARAVATEGIAHGETDPGLRHAIASADSAARRP
jgi:tetratricopeptide (TPR) repeat protein